MSLRIAAQAEPLPGYVLVERLGAGGFGEVWKAVAPGGIAKAIKIIHGDLRNGNDACFALQELKALSRVKQVRHPYLLALDRFDVVEGRLLIVMELADCNLWDRFVKCREAGLPGIPRHELLTYMLETAEVLDLFNDQFQLQHLDIKPQNLFLLHNHIKVADFGQVKDLQGLVATVTGGITPVYAAPETFDGVITRYCDQYSLACVYQELLTGRRPFDGTTPAQLLRQHLFQSPNLEPLPASDRPIVARALAKKPEERWPTVTAFVQHLIGSTPSGVIRFPALRRSAEASPTQTSPILPATPAEQNTETPRGVDRSSPQPLPPALVIGVGGAALPILQRLRWEWLQLAEGVLPGVAPPPPLEFLFIDTDEESIAQALQESASEGRAALPQEDVIHTPLQRMAYYMRPRPSGRLITEDWFDPGLLHVLPRQPRTEGVRMLGRLAFCDQHRLILQRLESSLRALTLASWNTPPPETEGVPPEPSQGLTVMIIAGLGGGTGSGMFVDLAYAVRSRLQQLDLPCATVQALLLLPPVQGDPSSLQLPLANSYAALLELAHYSRPDTLYTVEYEELHGRIQTRQAPFDRCFVVLETPQETETPPRRRDSAVLRLRNRREPGPTGSRVLSRPASRDDLLTPMPQRTLRLSLTPSDLLAAEILRLHLLTAVGQRLRQTYLHARTANTVHLSLSYPVLSHWRWPRRELLHRLALVCAQQCVQRWTELPAVAEPSQQFLTLAHHLWSELKLTPTQIREELEQVATAALGRPASDTWAELVAPHIPRSWFARLPQAARLEETVEQLMLLLGPPRPLGAAAVGVIEQQFTTTVDNRLHRLRKLLPKGLESWVWNHHLYLGGGEMLLMQWIAVAERFWNRFTQEAEQQAQAARDHYEVLMNAVHASRGLRRPGSGELREALRGFPEAQYATLLNRALLRFYHQLRDLLLEPLGQLRRAREQFANLAEEFSAAVAKQRRWPRSWLLPPDCQDLNELAQRLLRSLSPQQVELIDSAALESLHELSEGPLLPLLLEERGRQQCWQRLVHTLARLLPPCLQQIDFFHVLQQHYPTPADLQKVLNGMLQATEPPHKLGVSSSSTELLLVACPGGSAGATLRDLTIQTIPLDGLLLADLEDEWLLYREWAFLPWDSLPQGGTEAAAAYQNWREQCETSPHCRIDVSEWKAF
jgi:serine/threonine protein kinase